MEGLHHWWEFGKNPKLTSDDKSSTRRTGTSLDHNINKIDNNGKGNRNNNSKEGEHNEVYKDIMRIIPYFCRLFYIYGKCSFV